MTVYTMLMFVHTLLYACDLELLSVVWRCIFISLCYYPIIFFSTGS